jgi:hypothetical protein
MATITVNALTDHDCNSIDRILFGRSSSSRPGGSDALVLPVTNVDDYVASAGSNATIRRYLLYLPMMMMEVMLMKKMTMTPTTKAASAPSQSRPTTTVAARIRPVAVCPLMLIIR